MQEIQLIFNPGKGTSALSRITAVVGDRVGAMPKATRKGYIFGGWYVCPDGDPDSPDAIRVTAETVLDVNLLGGTVTDAVLYARWVKPTSAAAARTRDRMSRMATAFFWVPREVFPLATLLAAGLTQRAYSTAVSGSPPNRASSSTVSAVTRTASGESGSPSGERYHPPKI